MKKNESKGLADKKELKRQIDVAVGRKRADLVLKNAKVVNVFSHEVQEGTLAVDRGRIVGIGAYEGEREIDMEGAYLMPGLIDAHVHIESSLSSPEQFARAVVPRGTTAIVADPHEIANVCGTEGISYMLDASEGLPLRVFFMLPSCVPATSFENAGAVLDAENLSLFLDHPRVLGLGEMMDYPSLLAGDEKVLDKMVMASSHGMLIDGHGPMVLGKELNAYAGSGVETDHESSTIEEMRERLAVGMYCLIRQGSAARNLPDLIHGVNESNSRRCLFCTDDRQPEDILKEGHIDNHLRMAVARGVDPVTAIQMATINSAEAYGLKGTGALAPGYRADIVVVDDLKDFQVREVYIAGQKVAEKGRALFDPPNADISSVSGALQVKDFSMGRLELKLESDIVRVMRVQPESLITEEVSRKVHLDQQGRFVFHPSLDVLKMAVIERHNNTGHVGLGLVENYRLKRGAVALTIAHDSHNIIVIGADDRDMSRAVEELIDMGGGITMVLDGQVLSSLALPIAGLMSDRSADFVAEQLARMYPIARETLGVNPVLDPFMTLSFMALPVIPELKLTDLGLFDARQFRFVGIEVS
ncbi:MAG TPA: adenine deaminase [Sediminispirochaeta sp.]|nr:adenine deaminase [Sediminispirochaeta sp.]